MWLEKRSGECKTKNVMYEIMLFPVFTLHTGSNISSLTIFKHNTDRHDYI